MVAITRENGKSLNLEDFRQLEDETGTLPIPAQLYPINVEVDILIDGVWTDISQYVYQRDDIVVAGGSGSEDASSKSSSCTITINNRDGRFSPAYAGGAYFPYLQQNTPIRVWVTATSITGVYYSGIRFQGSVAKWPVQADTSQKDIYVQITANGPTRQTNQGGGKGGALARYYSLLKPPYKPIAYWPCEEDPYSTELGAGIDGGQTMIVTTGTPSWKSASQFNGSAPLGQLNNSTWYGPTGSTNQGSGDDIFVTPGAYYWQAPPGIVNPTAQALGGGGGGYGSDGGGGGGGEYASAVITVTPGNSYKVVVGVPGGKGNNGSSSTFFGDANGITAHGGSGASGNTGGAGGTGSSATLHFNGGAGANQQPSGTQISKVITATGFGNWQAPPGVTSVKVECYGGGGGGTNGGVIIPFASGGGGGGGGEYARENSVAITPGNTYIFAVGTGGGGGGYSNAGHQYGGQNGGSTVFQGDTTLVTAHGGTSAFYQSGTLSGGGGGTGSTNSVHHDGGAGNTGAIGEGGSGGGSCASSTSAGNAGSPQSGSAGGSGGGATSGTGVGDPGGAGGTGGNNTAGGQNGGGPGGGGGGGGQSSSGFHQGGNGAHGKLVLTYTPNVPSGGGGGGSAGSASAGNSATSAAGAAAVAYGGPGGDGGAQVAGNSPSSPPGGGGGGSGGGAGGASGASGQVEITYTPVGTPNWAVIRNVIYVPSHGGNPGRVLWQAQMSGALAYVNVVYSFAGNGSFQLVGYNVSNSVVFTSGILAANANGNTLMLSVELTNSGTSLKWALKAIVAGAKQILGSVSGTLASAQVGNVTSVTVAPNADITKTAMGHFSVQYAYVDLTLVSKAVDGHSGEMTIERFLRLANEQALDNAPQFNENTDHWGFEADLQGWQASNGALTRTSAWASEGQFSAVLTATGEGNPAAFSPQGLNGVPCNPGDSISVNVDVSTPQGLSFAYIGVRFWQGNGSASAITPEVDGTQEVVLADNLQYTDPMTNLPVLPKVEVTATVPSDATLYSIVVGDANADGQGTILRFDNVRAQPRMGAQTRHEFSKFLKEIKDLDRAIIKETHWDYNPYTGLPVVSPGLFMRTRWTLFQQNPVLTMDYSQGHCYGDLSPVIDDKLFKNHITVHRYKGSKVVVTLADGSTYSVTGTRGRIKKYLKLIAERDAQLLRLATLLLLLGTNPYERYPTIEFNFARPEVANLIGLAAAVEIGDFIQIVNLAFWYPTTTVKQLVMGYTEHINAFNWDVVWNCEPESPYELSVQQVGWY